MATEKSRTYPDVVISRNADAEGICPERGLSRKVLAYNDKLFLAEHRLEKGWVGALHSHPHEQVVYVVSGRLRVTTPGSDFEISAGDSFVVRGGINHAAAAIEDSLVIDVFTPCREDYIA
jgi:quercetin dioxygenase-like cupin family protein